LAALCGWVSRTFR